MIKDEKTREELFSKFPMITDEECDEIQDNYFTHYSLYKRTTKKHHLVCETVKNDAYVCHCTRCKCDYTIERELGSVPLKHKSTGVCPKCGKPVVFFAQGRGRQYIKEEDQFAVLHAIDGNLFISCYDVTKVFDKSDKNELAFFGAETHRYCLTPNGVQHWKYDWKFGKNGWERYWKVLKSENIAYGYKVINKQAIKDTFLRYAFDAIPDDIYHYRLQYLCFCASHRGAEYLVKTGFGYLIEAKMVSGCMHSIRLNWKSNNVKKILRLNKKEMGLLKDQSCGVLEAYYNFRKLDKTMSEEKRFEIAVNYNYYSDSLIKVMKDTGLSLQKVTNYLDKQGKTTSALYDWRDYIRQCKQLEYDLSDTLISMPKNLAKAHERLTKIIKIKVDELAKKAMAETLEKRKKLEYTSINGRYVMRVPTTVEEIVNEGKRLNHCVGGYAQRHANGKLNILFLRLTETPDVPYYTMEVSTTGEIIQCRGFKNNQANNPKPKEIEDFEQEYQLYLDTLFNRKKKGRKIA